MFTMFDLYDIHLFWFARERRSAVVTTNVHQFFIVIVYQQRLEVQKKSFSNTYYVHTYVGLQNKLYLYCIERIVFLIQVNVHMAVFYIRTAQILNSTR